MRNWLRNLFTVPEFPTEEATRLARQLNAIYLAAVALFLGLDILLAVLRYPLSTPSYWIFSILAIVFMVLIAVMRRGYLRQTAIVFISFSFAGLVFAAWTQTGVRDAAFIGLTAMILLTSVLLGQLTTWIFTGLSILAGFGMAYAQEVGLIPPAIDTPLNTALYMTVVFIANATFAYLAVNNLNASLKRAQTSEANLLDSNNELNSLRVSLEQQVEERTTELSKTTEQAKRRAEKFEAVADVAQATTAHLDPVKLLSDVTDMISEHFGYYHVGIFLLDEGRQSASLRAANSTGGKKMLEQNLKIDLADPGLVSQAISQGEARVASSVDSKYPDLPDTHSEAALPLRAGDRIIGALDIQSETPDAFNKEDIEILNILTSQVAIAIENSRLFSETTQALAEARTVYGQYLRQAWEQLPREARLAGFQYSDGEPNPLDQPLDLPEIQSALQTGKPVTHEEKTPAYAVPLKLRDQIIGVLDIRGNETSQQWSESQLTLVRAVAERVSLAIENARLFEETTRRADRERAVSEITSRIRSTTDPRIMLETAIGELKQVLGAKSIQIRPYTPAVIEKEGVRQPPPPANIPKSDLKKTSRKK